MDVYIRDSGDRNKKIFEPVNDITRWKRKHPSLRMKEDEQKPLLCGFIIRGKLWVIWICFPQDHTAVSQINKGHTLVSSDVGKHTSRFCSHVQLSCASGDCWEVLRKDNCCRVEVVQYVLSLFISYTQIPSMSCRWLYLTQRCPVCRVVLFILHKDV